MNPCVIQCQKRGYSLPYWLVYISTSQYLLLSKRCSRCFIDMTHRERFNRMLVQSVCTKFQRNSSSTFRVIPVLSKCKFWVKKKSDLICPAMCVLTFHVLITHPWNVVSGIHAVLFGTYWSKSSPEGFFHVFLSSRARSNRLRSSPQVPVAPLALFSGPFGPLVPLGTFPGPWVCGSFLGSSLNLFGVLGSTLRPSTPDLIWGSGETWNFFGCLRLSWLWCSRSHVWPRCSLIHLGSLCFRTNFKASDPL